MTHRSRQLTYAYQSSPFDSLLFINIAFLIYNIGKDLHQIIHIWYNLLLSISNRTSKGYKCPIFDISGILIAINKHQKSFDNIREIQLQIVIKILHKLIHSIECLLLCHIMLRFSQVLGNSDEARHDLLVQTDKISSEVFAKSSYRFSCCLSDY